MIDNSLTKIPVYLTLELLIAEDWVEVAVYPLNKICILLGRSKNLKPESGDILINDFICSPLVYSKISGVHLTFYRRSITDKEYKKAPKVAGYSVKDGGVKPSTNGTLLNGKKLGDEKINLNNGDVLQITRELRVIYHQKDKKVICSSDDTYTGKE